MVSYIMLKVVNFIVSYCMGCGCLCSIVKFRVMLIRGLMK